MIHSKLISNKTAVAGVIEALLLVALVAIILAIIQLQYIPEIMKDKEADHMDQVSNQFSYLKSVIEIQSTMGVINENNPNPGFAPYTSISSPLTLGSKELPYFVSARSSGQVELIDNFKATDYDYKININPAPAGFDEGIPLTSIKYDANNFYFIHQTYALEGGGIILKQSDGEVMRVNPAMNVVNNTNTIEINWNIPLFYGLPGKNITSDYKECYIRTNYTSYYEDEIFLDKPPAANRYIRIYTDYPDAWNQSLIRDDTGALWEYYDNGYINVEIDETTTPNNVIITPVDKNIDLKLTVVYIGVQIGAGTVIS